MSTLQNRVPVPADVACISDGLPETTLVITMTGTKTIAGIDNTEELRTASTITLSDGGEIVNGGLFVLSSGADIVGTSAGTGVERVTNYGTLRVAAGGTSTQIFNTVVVDSLGQVDVQSGQLFVDQVGNWREAEPVGRDRIDADADDERGVRPVGQLVDERRRRRAHQRRRAAEDVRDGP